MDIYYIVLSGFTSSIDLNLECSGTSLTSYNPIYLVKDSGVTTTTTIAATTTTTTTTSVVLDCYSGLNRFDVYGGGRLVEVALDGQSALIFAELDIYGDVGGTDWNTATSAVSGLTLGGYSDWRLPTLAEWTLFESYDWGLYFVDYVSDPNGFQNWSAYWSSDSINTNNAWGWWLGDGVAPYSSYGSQSNNKTWSLYVRPVRTDIC